MRLLLCAGLVSFAGCGVRVGPQQEPQAAFDAGNSSRSLNWMDSTNQELRKSVIPGNEATNRAASDSLHAALQLHIGQSVRWKFKLASIRADGAPVLAPLERTSDRTPEVIDRAVLTVADASKQDFVANASAETRIWLKTARPGEECLIVGEMSDLSAQSQFYVEGGKQNHKTTFAAQIQRATISKP